MAEEVRNAESVDFLDERGEVEDSPGGSTIRGTRENEEQRNEKTEAIGDNPAAAQGSEMAVEDGANAIFKDSSASGEGKEEVAGKLEREVYDVAGLELSAGENTGSEVPSENASQGEEESPEKKVEAVAEGPTGEESAADVNTEAKETAAEESSGQGESGEGETVAANAEPETKSEIKREDAVPEEEEEEAGLVSSEELTPEAEGGNY